MLARRSLANPGHRSSRHPDYGERVRVRLLCGWPFARGGGRHWRERRDRPDRFVSTRERRTMGSRPTRGRCLGAAAGCFATRASPHSIAVSHVGVAVYPSPPRKRSAIRAPRGHGLVGEAGCLGYGGPPAQLDGFWNRLPRGWWHAMETPERPVAGATRLRAALSARKKPVVLSSCASPGTRFRVKQ